MRKKIGGKLFDTDIARRHVQVSLDGAVVSYYSSQHADPGRVDFKIVQRQGEPVRLLRCQDKEAVAVLLGQLNLGTKL